MASMLWMKALLAENCIVTAPWNWALMWAGKISGVITKWNLQAYKTSISHWHVWISDLKNIHRACCTGSQTRSLGQEKTTGPNRPSTDISISDAQINVRLACLKMLFPATMQMWKDLPAVSIGLSVAITPCNLYNFQSLDTFTVKLMHVNCNLSSRIVASQFIQNNMSPS